VRIGRLDVRLHVPDQADDPARYWEQLDELAAILHGTPWALAGGAAVAVTIGRFYRPHYDIDIVFPLTAFAEIERAMLRADFQLYTHYPLSLLGLVRGAVHVPVRATGRLAQRRLRKLKFRDVSGRRSPPLAIVEAFPYVTDDTHYFTCDGRHRFPLSRPIVGHVHITSAGHAIPCYDLEYVAHYKWSKAEPKHFEDLAVIADHQSSAGPAGRRSGPHAEAPN
jgi:hypothetical protein